MSTALPRPRVPAFRRLIIALVFFAVVVTGGTIAYVLMVPAASWLDALYMTVISVSTVGFREALPLSNAGRMLTIGIIVLGVGSITFATVTSIEFLVEGHLQDLLGRRRMDRRLGRLTEHVIVCGFGRVGREAAQQLHDEGRPVVVVDRNPDRLATLAAQGMLPVEGDASHEEILLAAGLERAAGLVACTADDAENVLIALTAKGLARTVLVVVRIKDEENEQKARRAGADRVIVPTAIGGRRIAALITRPYVVDFLDVVTHGTDVDLVLEEVVVSERSRLAGASLRAARLRERYGANVVAIRQAGEAVSSTRANPDHVLCPGDVLVVIGGREDLDRLQAESR